MVKIRLRRMGAKKAPYYRIVVADSRSPRDGRCIEEIGTYNPLTQPATITVDAEKAQNWIKNGAQPTDTVRGLLKSAGVRISRIASFTSASFRRPLPRSFLKVAEIFSVKPSNAMVYSFSACAADRIRSARGETAGSAEHFSSWAAFRIS